MDSATGKETTMTKLLSLIVLVCLAVPARAAKKLRVVVSFPDLADVVKKVGGDRVDVDVLARGPEDPHQIVMRPSFVSKLNRADALVYNGLTLEHSFVPGLLEVAANPKMRPDWTQSCLGPGCIDCSTGLDPLDKPKTLSRAEGELHPQGNPHYGMGPQNDDLILKNIEEGLSRLDPAGQAEYEKNAKAYKAEVDAKVAELRKLVAPLKGVKAVSYHQDTAYLAQFTGLIFVGTIELKPGVAPTPSHLEELVKTMKDQNVKVIVQEQQYERKTSEWLSSKTGAKVGVIGPLGNWTKDTETQLKFQEKNLRNLVEAAASAKTAGGSR
jgi:zinc/manganese transport system substrate-binding protein